MFPSLLLTAQPEPYGVARCAAGSAAPDWAAGPGIIHVTQGLDETSVICPEDRIPADIETARGWACYRVDTLCDLDAPGVVLGAVQPVAEAGCGVLAISTYLRDYILVRAHERDAVLAGWLTAGHRVAEVGGLTLRRAEPADRDALAALHLRLWHQTYGPLAPAAIADKFDLPGRKSYWTARLARQGAADAVFLVEQAGEILGFCALQPQEHAGACPDLQIKHVFLDAKLRGQGLGRHFLCLARQQARRLGFDGVSLNVVEDNHAAVAFYQSQGGTIAGRYTDPGPLWKSQNTLFRWPTQNT